MPVKRSYLSHAASVTCSSGREPALTDILASDSWILNSGPSSLSQAIPTYPRLSQPFLGKKDCLFPFESLMSTHPKIHLSPSVFGTLRKATVTYCRLLKAPPGGDISRPLPRQSQWPGRPRPLPSVVPRCGTMEGFPSRQLAQCVTK